MVHLAGSAATPEERIKAMESLKKMLDQEAKERSLAQATSRQRWAQLWDAFMVALVCTGVFLVVLAIPYLVRVYYQSHPSVVIPVDNLG